MAKRVYLDPGHGGHDSGAVGNGLREKDLTLKIARYARNYLQANYQDVSVRMSRTGDTYPSLSARANDANNWNADVFVSIHINAGGGVGYEDYIFNRTTRSSTRKLQEALHREIAPLFTKTRGRKRANFAVLRQTNMPAVLTENGFIDSQSDADILRKDSNLKKIGEAHAKGIAVFLGLDKGSSQPAKKPSSSSPKKSASPKRSNRSIGSSGGSIVDYLKSIHVDSSFRNRKKLAQQYGIANYRGTAAQNRELLNKMKSGTKPKRSNRANLKVDGKWGPATTRALQRALGTPVDGVISSQPRNRVTQALYGGVTWGSKGSSMVRALQRRVGATRDGKLGPVTVRRLQRHLGTPIDGVLSRPSSLVVKELQRRLNAGTF